MIQQISLLQSQESSISATHVTFKLYNSLVSSRTKCSTNEITLQLLNLARNWVKTGSYSFNDTICFMTEIFIFWNFMACSFVNRRPSFWEKFCSHHKSKNFIQLLLQQKSNLYSDNNEILILTVIYAATWKETRYVPWSVVWCSVVKCS
jgi:hypothetical protein